MLHRALLDLSPSKQLSEIHGALIAVGLVLATLAVYYAGGSQSALPHLLYIPVTAGALCFGTRGGAFAGVVAGLLVGPLMPLNVEAGLGQETTNWLIRLGMFTGVGIFVGIISTQRLHRIEALAELNADSIRAFVRTIDVKSEHTARHSEKVAQYALWIGEEMGLDSAQLDRLHWAAMLHDIGKLRVPSEVLNKPGKLDEREQDLIKRHPIDSVHILEGIHHFEPYLPAIRHHHERFDGAGYPDGLSGDAIPIEARILAIADAYDAMTTARPYRAAMTAPDAIEQLRACAGTQFDPTVVSAFERAKETAPSREAQSQRAMRPHWASNLLGARSRSDSP